MIKSKIEKFDMKDIHSGYVVKFRNGHYALCMRVGSRCENGDYKPIKIFARVDDNAQMNGACLDNTFVYADSYKGSFYHPYDRKIGIASPYPNFDIVEVYGLIEHVRNYLNIGDTGPISIKNRPLLWAETKKMTVKEIEDALGYKVEIVKEKHIKTPEECKKCKYGVCPNSCSTCTANLNLDKVGDLMYRSKCRCNLIPRGAECHYFEEK